MSLVLTQSYFKLFMQVSQTLNWSILQLNRNARAPKRANHGARPCSSVVRRLRHKGEFKKIKENTPLEQEEFTAQWEDI